MLTIERGANDGNAVITSSVKEKIPKATATSVVISCSLYKVVSFLINIQWAVHTRRFVIEDPVFVP